jgi:hypothetical protein
VARHDFRCPNCGDIDEVDVPISMGARAAIITCSNCSRQMEWIPAIGRMDYGPSGGTGFKGFTIEEEIRGETQRIQIDSLSALRKVERESEVRARNGEGRPLVWRDYQQGRTNRDVHTLSKNLADPHGVAPTVNPAVASGKVKPRRGAAVTKAHGTI